MFTSASVTGAFSSVELPSLPGFAWDASQLASGVLSVVLPADFNGDGVVNGADLVDWRAGFGMPSGATHTQGDADGDADGDGGDFLVWQRQIGSPAIAAATASIPEPAISALLASGASAMTLRRRVARSHKLIRR